MRVLLVSVLAAFSFASTLPAAAENKTFVIANVSDGYGVDQCLTTGARCGALLANAYCQAHDFQTAASFRKLGASDVTGAILVADAKAKDSADALIAIECSR
jgi:hypothetical protein